jgi:branched-chain amino acid transport system substrate-binding protein
VRSSVLARSRARVRARPLTVAACTTLVAALGGCAAASSTSVSVTGRALTIYLSAPSQGLADQQTQDVLGAEQLALQQSGSQIGTFKINLVRVTSNKLSDNARTAIEDTTTIAYIGELAPGTSADTLGITNDQDVLQVTPTDTALELTEPTGAVPGAPTLYYEALKTYGRTFARVVPNAAQEAKAQVQEMQSLGVKKLYVSDDGSEYGKAIALAVKNTAAAPITVVSGQAGADAVFYGGSNVSAADRIFNATAQTSPGTKLFGPSALDNGSFAAGLSSAARNVYISAPGFLPKDVPPAGQKFLSDFKAAYGHSPAPEAIFGYEAMTAVLDVLKEAGSAASNRSTVVRDFFSIRSRASVLGTYSINANGDTSLAPFVFSRLKAGKLVPSKFVQVQG